MISVIIIDDHKILLEGMEALINRSDGARVMSVGYSVGDCRKLLAWGLPDVLMLDVGLPDGDGCVLCAELMRKYPALKILMLTAYAEIAVIRRALDGGALGYVLKNATSGEIIEAIYTIAAGERFLCEEVNITLEKNDNHPIELTRREKELLLLIADGYTLPDLADKMCLGQQTIRSYRKNLNVKLDAHNTAQLLHNAKGLRLI